MEKLPPEWPGNDQNGGPFPSIRKQPKVQSSTIEEKGNVRRIEHAEEAVGTIVIDVNETGRHILRRQPSLDPNDPLARIATI
jgi:hypothetical protein